MKGNPSDLHLTLPDILSPEEGIEVGYFGVGLKPGRKQAYTQVAIEDYVEELKAGQIADIADMSELRASHEVRVIDLFSWGSGGSLPKVRSALHLGCLCCDLRVLNPSMSLQNRRFDRLVVRCPLTRNLTRKTASRGSAGPLLGPDKGSLYHIDIAAGICATT